VWREDASIDGKLGGAIEWRGRDRSTPSVGSEERNRKKGSYIKSRVGSSGRPKCILGRHMWISGSRPEERGELKSGSIVG